MAGPDRRGWTVPDAFAPRPRGARGCRLGDAPTGIGVGTGTRAKLVGRTLQKSDPHVDLVGYYASPNEAVAEVSAWGILSPNMSLTDIAIEQQVDEIVVALAERRGGSMPLRELLDCKLQGVRVVDMATHFEKTLGQIRLDSVSAAG